MADKAAPDLRLVNPAEKSPDGVFWDKPAPTGPPQPIVRNIPPHLDKVMRFFSGIIADEGLLLELCVDKATSIVEFNVKKRLIGTDLMEAGGQMHPFNLVAAASPLAVELYKNVLLSVGQRQEEYEALREAAHEELKNGQRKSPSILLP